jgi:IMP dehydrogenase
MKTVRDLPLWPLWVNPEHRAKSALVMMKGHGVPCLGVMKGDTFLGLICIEDLVGVGEEEPVELVMRRGVETVPPDMPLRRVAELMSAKGLDAVPVMREEEFLGIVTAHELLNEVWRNTDPLTQLPWSDSLREWGIARLLEGIEVTILFFDLDSFGQFNKKYGHIVGDRVLQSVSDVLQGGIDPSLDHLVRFGGDEFAIATMRTREDAQTLAAWLQQRVRAVRVEGAEEAVGVSVGIFGGRRTKERENVHFAATMDNLINLASRQAIAAKAQPAPDGQEPTPPHPEAPRPAMDRPEVLSARTTHGETGVRAVIVLRHGGKLHTGVYESESSEAEAAAHAAAAALGEVMGGPLISVHEATLADSTISVSASIDGNVKTATRPLASTEAETAAETLIDAALG